MSRPKAQRPTEGVFRAEDLVEVKDDRPRPAYGDLKIGDEVVLGSGGPPMRVVGLSSGQALCRFAGGEEWFVPETLRWRWDQ